MTKSYSKLLKESADNILTNVRISVYLKEQDAGQIQQEIQKLQAQLQQTQDPQIQYKIKTQIYNLQAQLKQMQAQAAQAAQQQQQGSEQQQGPDPMAVAGQAAQVAGVAMTANSAVNAAPEMWDKAKRGANFVKKNVSAGWNKLGTGGKAGVIGAGVALGGYALWKMKKARCRNKCMQLGDEAQIQNCLRGC